ncbi:hypothetical protein [Okeania sp. SIO2B3]|uniref:hypothetical protein n=1 Tax=Okeania sp. SIO2B3 TaxID=2607784 RepID=UPI0013C0531D|nr:hypothetical protein [Okeania sp. SIO2B3]NET44198.1 hypothetical protein [Okeania sp. SIO2B3]
MTDGRMAIALLPERWDIYRPGSECQYKFERCGRLDRECLWMSSRRRSHKKQEVNIKISRYVTFYISFMKQERKVCNAFGATGPDTLTPLEVTVSLIGAHQP